MLTALVLLGLGRRFYLKGYPALWRLAPDMNSLVAVGTSAAFAYSVVATFLPDLLPPGTVNVYFEAAAVIVTLILLGRSLEAWAKGRTSQSISRLLGLQPRMARVHQDDMVVEVPIAEVRTGNLLDLRPGERVRVIVEVTAGDSWIDEFRITGELAPVAKVAGAAVTGGTVNQTGALTFRATAVGDAAMLAQTIRMVERPQLGCEATGAGADRRSAPQDRRDGKHGRHA